MSTEATAVPTVEVEIKVVAKKGDGFPIRRYENTTAMPHDQARKLIKSYEALCDEAAGRE